MSLTVINESLRAWAGMSRPLKGLTKAQLWKYPLANPSAEAEWDVGKEMLARLTGYRAIEHEVVRAEEGVQRLKQRLYGNEVQASKCRDKVAQAKAALEEATKLAGSEPPQEKMDLEAADQIAKLAENVLAQTKANLAKQEAAVLALKAKLADAPKSDTIVSADEIHQHYATRYAAAWSDTLRRWNEGSLFKAQTAGWHAFLKMKGHERAADLAAYWAAEGMAKLALQEKSRDFIAINALYCIRILPALGARRQYLADGSTDGDIQTAQLKAKERAEFWNWRRAYVRASIAWKWIDDEFGNSFDPAQVGSVHPFNPYEEHPDERYAD